MSSLKTSRKLVSLDDMFGSTEEASTPTQKEVLQSAEGESGQCLLPVGKLYPKRNHRFQTNLGKKNEDLLQSIREFGVLEPVIVRPLSDAGGEGDTYEILAGHRRTAMAKEAGLEEIPAIIKNGLSEEEADLIETETNLLQRSWEDMSHSERAEVLYAHYNAVKYKGIRTGFLEEINAEIQTLAKPVNSMAEEGLSQVATKGNLRASGKAYELSKDTVGRYLRIYALIQELKDRMDLDEIALVAGVELSYLAPEHQVMLDELLDSREYKLNIQKAEALRRLEMQGKLQEESMKEVLCGKQLKKPGRPKAVKVNPKIISRYFEEGTNQKEIEATIEAALEAYFANNKI